MRTLIFTLGFDVTSVIAKISETGLQGDEELVFITMNTDSPRATASRMAMESHIKMLNTRGMNLKYLFVELDASDPSMDIKKIYDALYSRENLVVELTGGMRYTIILTYFVAQILSRKLREVSTRLESGGANVRLPVMRIMPLTRREARILNESLIPVTQKRLAESLQRKASNISRAIRALEQSGLIIKVKDEKPALYRITPLGKIYLEEYTKQSDAKKYKRNLETHS